METGNRPLLESEYPQESADQSPALLQEPRRCECGRRVTHRSKSGVCFKCRGLDRKYLPTPEQIQSECARIRAEWTETRWREARDASAWVLPRVRVTLQDFPTNQASE
jgi:hypothetical protein